MELRQRLNLATLSPPSTSKGDADVKKRQTGKPHRFVFKTFTVAVLVLGTVGFDQWSNARSVTGNMVEHLTISNSKIFHHNRTSPAEVALHLTQQKKENEKMGRVKKPAKFKSQMPPRPPPHPSQHMNINNYFKTAINILTMGLGAVTPKSTTWRPPSDPPNPMHPLTILQTQLPSYTWENGEKVNRSSNGKEGRSALEFEPLFEASYDHNKTGQSGHLGKKMEQSFFEKFEDWDDSLAQESSPPNSFTVVDPPRLNSGSIVPPHLHVDSITQPRPPWPSQSSQSAPDDNNPNHKNVNYWPNNLNSYYGIQTNPAYPQHQHRPVSGPSAGYGYPGSSSGSSPQRYDDDHYDTASSEHESMTHENSSIMERVSIFYANYKVLAWGIIVVVAAAVAVGALVGLYVNNPPTEVVTARKELSRAMNDPRLMTFMDKVLDLNKNSNKSLKTRPRRRN